MVAGTALFRVLRVAPLLCAGCCPIPVPDDVMVFPAATIVVHDAGGQPIEGARVFVHAELQPHASPEDPTLELATDADGKAVVEARSVEQTVYPLMMHGVPAYSWHLCVDHPRHGAAVSRLHHENPEAIVVELKGEVGNCAVHDGDLMGKSPSAPPPTDATKAR
jgi:hypothetical protein